VSARALHAWVHACTHAFLLHLLQDLELLLLLLLLDELLLLILLLLLPVMLQRG
jgi:hypothetical protein